MVLRGWWMVGKNGGGERDNIGWTQWTVGCKWSLRDESGGIGVVYTRVEMVKSGSYRLVYSLDRFFILYIYSIALYVYCLHEYFGYGGIDRVYFSHEQSTATASASLS